MPALLSGRVCVCNWFNRIVKLRCVCLWDLLFYRLWLLLELCGRYVSSGHRCGHVHKLHRGTIPTIIRGVELH